MPTPENRRPVKPGDEGREDTSELFRRFQDLKPKYASKAEAFQGVSRDLEAMAARHGKSVENLLQEAHTTRHTESHHVQALSLERQLAHLRR